MRFQIDKSINEEDLQRLRTGGDIPATKQQQIRAIERTISSLDQRISNAIARAQGDKPSKVIQARETAYQKLQSGQRLTKAESRRAAYVLGKQFQRGRTRFSEQERELLIQTGRLEPEEFSEVQSNTVLSRAQFENEKRQEQIRRQINLEYKQDYLGRINDTVDKLNEKARADSPGSPREFRQERFDYIVKKIQEKGGLPDKKITATNQGFGAAITPQSAEFTKGFEGQLGSGEKFNILDLSGKALFPNIIAKAKEILPKEFQVTLTQATPFFLKEGIKSLAEKTQAPSIRFRNIVEPKLRRETARLVKTYPGLGKDTLTGLQTEFISKEQQKFADKESKKRYDSASKIVQIGMTASKKYDEINKSVSEFKFIPVGSRYGGFVSLKEFFGGAARSTTKAADLLQGKKGFIARASEFSLRTVGGVQTFIGERPLTAPVVYGASFLAGPVIGRLSTIKTGAVGLRIASPLLLSAAGLTITEATLGAKTRQGKFNIVTGEAIKFGLIAGGIRFGAKTFLNQQATNRVFQVKTPRIKVEKTVGGKKGFVQQGLSESIISRPQFKKLQKSYGANSRVTTITKGTLVDQFEKFKVFAITRGRVTRGSLTGTNPYGFKKTIVFKQVKDLVNYRIIDSSGKITGSGQFTSSESFLKGLKFKNPIYKSEIARGGGNVKYITPEGNLVRPAREIGTFAQVKFFGKGTSINNLKVIRKAIAGNTISGTVQADVIRRPQIEVIKYGFPKPSSVKIIQKVPDIVYSKNPVLKPNIQIFKKSLTGQGTIEPITVNIQRGVLETSRKFVSTTRFVYTFKTGLYIPKPRIDFRRFLIRGKKGAFAPLGQERLTQYDFLKPAKIETFVSRKPSVVRLTDPGGLVADEILIRLGILARARTGVYGVPLIRTDPIIKNLLRTETRTKIFTEPKITPFEIPKVEVEPLIRTALRTEVQVKTETKPKSRTITETLLSPKPGSGLEFVPIIPPEPVKKPKIPDYFFELKPGRVRTRRSDKQGRKTLRYQPSLVAKYFDIRDEIPELLSGLGLRPIRGKRRKKRK